VPKRHTIGTLAGPLKDTGSPPFPLLIPSISPRLEAGGDGGGQVGMRWGDGGPECAILAQFGLSVAHQRSRGWHSSGRSECTPIQLRGGNLALSVTGGTQPITVTTNSSITALGNSTYSGNILLTNNPTATLDSARVSTTWRDSRRISRWH
jgi:hypothetical protein